MTNNTDPARNVKMMSAKDFSAHVDAQLQRRAIEPPEPPPCILFGWIMRPDGRIYADRVENHPRIGTGERVLTSVIVYINETLGVAASKQTAYVLRDKRGRP